MAIWELKLFGAFEKRAQQWKTKTQGAPSLWNSNLRTHVLLAARLECTATGKVRSSVRGRIVSKSTHEWPRVRMRQNILLMSRWRHHYIIVSNNHYFTANWPFLVTLIPGCDISAISDWMGEGLGDGQGGERGGVQTSRHPHPLISVPATFLTFSSRAFFRLPYTSLPLFYPESQILSTSLPTPTPPKGDQGRKKNGNDKYKN